MGCGLPSPASWAPRIGAVVDWMLYVLLGPATATGPTAAEPQAAGRPRRRVVRHPATGASVRTLCGLGVAAGALTGATSLLPSPPGFRVVPAQVIGGITILLGITLPRLPWGRLRPVWALSLVPVGFLLIAVHNTVEHTDPYRYSIYFVLVFVWLGMHHPPGTAAACAPLATLTYICPLLSWHAHAGEVGTVAYAVPVFVLVGETLALRSASLQRAQAELRRVVDHDLLTGLANRGLFLRRVDQALAHDGEAAVIFVDVDDFKQVNDRNGHEAGDRVLQRIAASMVASCRPGDVVARWAGDEFTILLTGAEAARQARTVAERLCDDLEAVDSPCGTPRVSAGVAAQRGGTADTLIAAADEAMYRVKHGRRAGVTHVTGIAAARSS